MEENSKKIESKIDPQSIKIMQINDDRRAIVGYKYYLREQDLTTADSVAKALPIFARGYKPDYILCNYHLKDELNSHLMEVNINLHDSTFFFINYPDKEVPEEEKDSTDRIIECGSPELLQLLHDLNRGKLKEE